VTAGPASIVPFYADWRGYNERVVEHLRSLSAEDLALRSSPGHDYLPIWAIAAHTVGARVYWLCHVFGEPGAETTPFGDPDAPGWEDELEVVRSGDEVVGACEHTRSELAAIVSTLDEATLSQLADRTRAADRDLAGGDQIVISTTVIIIILLILILLTN